MRTHDIRLALLAMAILAGLAVQRADNRDVARCNPCIEAVETS